MSLETTQGWAEFLRLCLAADSESQLEELFSLFFTLEEKHALATRALLIKELLRGQKTQREIAQNLNISVAKITRGSNALKIVSKQLKQYILQVFDKK